MIATDIQWHSQAATKQDQWVAEKLDFKKGGTFIEVGANDGVRHSNTLTLEEAFGWTGLLIEADPSLHAACRARRGGKSVNAAIGPHDANNENFAIGGSGGSGSNAYSGLTRFMSPKWLDGHEFHKSKIVQVNTYSLRTILEMHWPNSAFGSNDFIDYLSLDVEGAELAILQSFMGPRSHLSKREFRFRCITVEFLYDREILRNLESVLGSEYDLAEVRAFDACFVHRSI